MRVVSFAGVYHVEKHPDVVEGKKTAEEVLSNLLKSMEGGAACTLSSFITFVSFRFVLRCLIVISPRSCSFLLGFNTDANKDGTVTLKEFGTINRFSGDLFHFLYSPIIASFFLYSTIRGLLQGFVGVH